MKYGSLSEYLRSFADRMRAAPGSPSQKHITLFLGFSRFRANATFKLHPDGGALHRYEES